MLWYICLSDLAVRLIFFMITVNKTESTIRFTPHAHAEKNGQKTIERKVVSAHLCPRCHVPIQAVVLTKDEIDLSLIGEGSAYESWPIGNVAGPAAVQLVAKSHLSDGSVSEESGKGLRRKSLASGRSCPIIAFFSPSPAEQVKKLLSPIGALRIADVSEKDLFPILVNDAPGPLLIIEDALKQFHPMFALDLGHPTAFTDFRWALFKRVSAG